MKAIFYFCLVLCLLLGLSSVPLKASMGEAKKVVVVININDPDSIAIGRYYIEKRGIPERNLIEIDAPKEETISLRQYVDRVHNPILEALLEGDWISGVKAPELDQYGRARLLVSVHKIRFLVTTKGVPLRFNNDSELIGEGIQNIQSSFS